MSDARAPRRICLIGGSLAADNHGVGALTLGALRAIRSALPDAEISLLEYSKTGAVYQPVVAGHRVSVPLIDIRFSKKVYLANNVALLVLLALLIRLVPVRAWRTGLMRRNAVLRRLDEMDLFASLAGGDSFSTSYGLGRLLYVSLPQLLVIALRKRLVLLPQTLGPFRGALSRAIARFILRRADAVYSRDREGVEEMAVLMASTEARPARFCHDLGFLLEPVRSPNPDLVERPRRPAATSCMVGLNVSGLLFIGGYRRNNFYGLRMSYEELVLGIADLLIRDKHASLLLIPHVFGSQDESDVPASEQVYRTLRARYGDRVGIVRGSCSPGEIKHVIGQCDFFVGARMHACIGALSQEVPTVSIAYSEKFAGVMATLNLPSLVADPRVLDLKRMLARVDRSFEDRGMTRARLRHAIPEAEGRALNLFREVLHTDEADEAFAVHPANIAPRVDERLET